MKRAIIFLTGVALILWAVFPVSCNAWDVKVSDGAKTKPGSDLVMSALSECVIIDINEKTQIKACKCGSVAVQEWKEIVPNKDSSYIYYGSGTGILLTTHDPRMETYTVPAK